MMWQKAEGLSSQCDSPLSDDDLLYGFGSRTVSQPSIARRRSSLEIAYSELEGDDKGQKYTDKRKSTKKFDLHDLAAKESAHADKHRQLKVMLREQRQQSRSLSSSRHLVSHLARSKDGSTRCKKMIDQQRVDQSVSRISGHLHGCSQSRHELQEMTKKMASVLAPSPSASNLDLKNAFGDAFAGLRRQRAIDHE